MYMYSIEPGFDYLHALAPYQPLNMKVSITIILYSIDCHPFVQYHY